MLLQLKIENLILIENTSVTFGSGLNVISGETGSGKSAFIQALSLLKGEKASVDLIRHGKEKACVEGAFSVPDPKALLQILQEEDIDWEENTPLEVRRELSKSGKSRTLINQQLATLSLLKKMGQFLFKMTGQHASTELFSSEKQRSSVDLYGELVENVQAYTDAFVEVTQAKNRLKSLLDKEGQRIRFREQAERELQEIGEVHFEIDEEEMLFKEYETLSQNDEAKELTAKALELFQNERGGILSLLKRHKSLFDQLAKTNPAWLPSFLSLISEAEDLAYSIQSTYIDLENSPERLQELQEKLTYLNRIKKKYGSSLQEIFAYREDLKQKLIAYESEEKEIECLQETLPANEARLLSLSRNLTDQRKQAAEKLSRVITAKLGSLNMPNCQFVIHVTPIELQKHGGDSIEFFMTPNVGESAIALRESASGGEISRVLLALNLALAGKAPASIFVFDEIDANIGGETAVLIGQMLKDLAQGSQVFCITHFPQVAALADHHFQVLKLEKNGRTFSDIQALSIDARSTELQRMLGGHKDLLARSLS